MTGPAAVRGALSALGLALLLAGVPAQAHKASDSDLTVQVVAEEVAQEEGKLQGKAQGAEVTLRWDISLRDLDRELQLDADDDGRLNWREVRERWPAIVRYADAGLQVAADGQACVPTPAAAPPQLTRHSDGAYVALTRQLRCPVAPRALSLDYRLFADSDPTHRGLLRLLAPGREPQAAVLVPGAGPRDFVLAEPRTPWQTLGEFTGQGLWHIAIGADHILFLLSLLIGVFMPPPRGAPAAASAESTAPTASTRLAPRLASVLRVVTAFTLAHSLTLALSVLGVWSPPSRWVESLIAASVVLAALNNLWPVVSHGRWRLTFAFGLVHGFGFAGALKDVGLGGGSLLWPLLGFNLGVELGQLLIVAVFVPLAWALRATRFYRQGVVLGGSTAMALMAALWLVERLFDLNLTGL